MADRIGALERWVGTSSEAKRTDIPVGSTWLETDTGLLWTLIPGGVWAVLRGSDVTVSALLVLSSLVGGATSSASTALDVDNLPQPPSANVTARVTFPATHSGGATVSVYGSIDSVNYDNVVYATFLVPTTTGTAIQKTIALDISALSAFRVTITNNDASNALGAITIHASKRI